MMPTVDGWQKRSQSAAKREREREIEIEVEREKRGAAEGVWEVCK